MSIEFLSLDEIALILYVLESWLDDHPSSPHYDFVAEYYRRLDLVYLRGK